MGNISIFSDSFIANLKNVLDDKCKDGGSISSTVVCSELGVDTGLKNTISLAINMGVAPDFTLSKGRGIHRIDAPVVKGAKKLARIKRKKDETTETEDTATATETPKKKSKLTEEFLLALRTTLEELCASSARPVPRKEVAKAMGMEGTKAELMVSDALKLDSFSDFIIKAGRNGGIVFAAEALQASMDEDDNTIVLPEDGLDLDVALTMTEEDSETLTEVA
jgi:hypothetical protein